MFIQLKKNDEYLSITSGSQLQDFFVKQFKEAKAPVRDIYLASPERQKDLIGFELPVYKSYDKKSEYYERLLDDGLYLLTMNILFLLMLIMGSFS